MTYEQLEKRKFDKLEFANSVIVLTGKVTNNYYLFNTI